MIASPHATSASRAIRLQGITLLRARIARLHAGGPRPHTVVHAGTPPRALVDLLETGEGNVTAPSTRNQYTTRGYLRGDVNRKVEGIAVQKRIRGRVRLGEVHDVQW